MESWVVLTEAGNRTYQADDYDHAVEQSEDAFPDETVILAYRHVEEA